ncbi:hypothetical protein [Tahibacter soli]|uniref:Uncharacterized protein n=1 Tax=Tahibacter soli TaxID=2983605 RepID=A0A9X4BJV8_9GAMM|nr:hypothetical protein [Tahibacter soli]MDC8012569.1 hypothetical protein [Tahibacter soli]
MISISFVLLSAISGCSEDCYLSDNYGYSFRHEGISAFCAETPPAPSHGFSFSMQKVSCDDLRTRSDISYVVFWAEYNVVKQSDGARHLATEVCVGKPVLSRRGFNGLTTFECKSKEVGRNGVHFFAQSEGGVVEQRVNYYATAFLSGSKSDEDLVAHVRRISVGEQK